MKAGGFSVSRSVFQAVTVQKVYQCRLFPEIPAGADGDAAAPADVAAAFSLIRSCERTLPLLLAADGLAPGQREALLRAAKKLYASLGMALAAAEGARSAAD